MMGAPQKLEREIVLIESSIKKLTKIRKSMIERYLKLSSKPGRRKV